MKKNIYLLIFILLLLIFLDHVYAYDKYSVGEFIEYKGEGYYVIENSDSNKNYVTLLRENSLSYSELMKYSDDKSKVHHVQMDYAGLDYNIGLKNINILFSIIDNWVEDNFEENELVEVDNYYARILNENDLIDNLGFELKLDVSSCLLEETSQAPKWVYGYKKNPDYDDDNDSDYSSYCLYTMVVNPLNLENEDYLMRIPKYGYCRYKSIKPVIYLNKAVLEPEEDTEVKDLKGEKSYIYKEYNIGDEIYYNNEKYYVISNSKSTENYLELLKDEPLTIDEIKKYNNNGYNDYNDEMGKIQYFDVKYCVDDTSYNYYTCDSSYEKSKVKKVIDNWVKQELNNDDLKEVDGLKARVLTRSEYENFLNNENKKFIVETSYKYWVSDLIEQEISSYRALKPVINLKKAALDNNTYQIGNLITYLNNDYYVIEDNDDYVVLLKKIPLTSNQILIYNNKYGVMPYFKSDRCTSRENMTGCSTNYETSLVKSTLDNWANDKDILKDLISVKKYKIRLLTKEDLLNNLGYSYHSIITKYTFDVTEDVPKWVYSSDFEYWTMSSDDEIYDTVYVILNSGIADLADIYYVRNENSKIYNYNAVRPVINLNKCVLDGGCIEIDNGCNQNISNEVDNNKTVIVEDTIKLVSKILLIISVVLIISGSCVIVYNYLKSKISRNS